MLKFVAGYVKDKNGKEIKTMILGFNHTAITHGDLAKYLDSVVSHAGFCNLSTENLFMHFYGRSISVNMGCEDMDILAENEFIKEGYIRQYELSSYYGSKSIYVITEKDNNIEKENLVYSGTINLREWNDLLDDQFRTQF